MNSPQEILGQYSVNIAINHAHVRFVTCVSSFVLKICRPFGQHSLDTCDNTLTHAESWKEQQISDNIG